MPTLLHPFPRLILAVCLGALSGATAAHASTLKPAGLTLRGDPRSPEGATWTYDSTDDGVRYVLEGILYAPPASQLTDASRHPAVILHHGVGQSAYVFGQNVGRPMAQWGMVAMAVNYTWAKASEYKYQPAGFSCGAPGLALEPSTGWAQGNALLRAEKALQILQSLPYVDSARLAAHGHSRGAFLNVLLVGKHPTAFRAASHSAGGMISSAQGQLVTVPYSMHHAQLDTNVTFPREQAFAAVLEQNRVAHELITYDYPDLAPTKVHAESGKDPRMLSKVRAWYVTQGVLRP